MSDDEQSKHLDRDRRSDNRLSANDVHASHGYVIDAYNDRLRIGWGQNYRLDDPSPLVSFD